VQRRNRKHVQSPDLNQTKVTPRTRPVHEARHDGQLLNADPNKKYVLAPKDEAHPFSYQLYESMGYKLEEAQKDGVRIVLGTTPVIGKPLEWRGHALLSCSKELAEKIFLEGPNGMTGQNYYDKLMQQIKRGNLEKRSNVPGLTEQWEIGELEQNAAPEEGVFRE
jgi:hypothetical protein